MLQYGNPPQLFSSQHHHQQQQQQRAIFSPDSTPHAILEDGPFPSPMAFSQLQQAQQTPLQHHPDARQLMQMHQRRSQSPAPTHGGFFFFYVYVVFAQPLMRGTRLSSILIYYILIVQLPIISIGLFNASTLLFPPLPNLISLLTLF